MIFRFKDKEYQGATAIKVVRQIKRDETEFAKTGGSIQKFVAWSLKKLSDYLPPRELDLSPHVSDDVQADSSLSLRHDFSIGELIE